MYTFGLYPLALFPCFFSPLADSLLLPFLIPSTYLEPCCDRIRPPWSQVARKLILISIPPHLLPICSPSVSHSETPTPCGFPKLMRPLLRRHRNSGFRDQHTPLAMSSSLVLQSLVLFTALRAILSAASTSIRDPGCPSLRSPLGHQEYFLRRSSMLRVLLLDFSSSGSRSASVSIICPTRSPTPSIAASIQRSRCGRCRPAPLSPPGRPSASPGCTGSGRTRPAAPSCRCSCPARCRAL